MLFSLADEKTQTATTFSESNEFDDGGGAFKNEFNQQQYGSDIFNTDIDPEIKVATIACEVELLFPVSTTEYWDNILQLKF